MKTIKLLIASIFIFVFVACQEDKPIKMERNTNNNIHGSWTLVNVSGGFAGMINNFQPGWIVWTFNPTSGLLTIENNNPMENPLYDGFETGNYFFSSNTHPSNCQSNFQSLKIGEFHQSCYRITNNEMIIDDNIAADGFQYKLIRFTECGTPNI